MKNYEIKICLIFSKFVDSAIQIPRVERLQNLDHEMQHRIFFLFDFRCIKLFGEDQKYTSRQVSIKSEKSWSFTNLKHNYIRTWMYFEIKIISPCMTCFLGVWSFQRINWVLSSICLRNRENELHPNDSGLGLSPLFSFCRFSTNHSKQFRWKFDINREDDVNTVKIGEKYFPKTKAEIMKRQDSSNESNIVKRA